MRSIEPDTKENANAKSLKKQIAAYCTSFMRINEMHEFRLAEFMFYRLEIRIAGTFCITDLNGGPFSIDFPLCPELELLLIRYWADRKMKSAHQMRLRFTMDLLPEVRFIRSYVLMTLERKGTEGNEEAVRRDTNKSNTHRN